VLFALIVIVLLVVFFGLLLSISHGEHFAPQAYYRRKRIGAPVAYGLDRLGPRLRKRLPQELEPPIDGPEDVPVGAPASRIVETVAKKKNYDKTLS
jgi:hypothetical protein